MVSISSRQQWSAIDIRADQTALNAALLWWNPTLMPAPNWSSRCLVAIAFFKRADEDQCSSNTAMSSDDVIVAEFFCLITVCGLWFWLWRRASIPRPTAGNQLQGHGIDVSGVAAQVGRLRQSYIREPRSCPRGQSAHLEKLASTRRSVAQLRFFQGLEMSVAEHKADEIPVSR